MNVERRLICVGLLLGLSFSMADAAESLETTYRTHGPRMHQLVGQTPARQALQQSSAVIQRGRTELAYGTVVSPDGYILTKASEVPDLTGVSVTVDQQSYPGPKLIATDPRWDVALLKIDAAGLTPVKISGSPDPDRGTWVVANGATTRREREVQVGIISANARELKEKDGMVPGIAFDEDDGKLVVSDLAKDGGAMKAGFEEGDVIVSVLNQPVSDVKSLVEALKGHLVGEKVAIAVKREEKDMSLSVALGEMGSSNDRMNAYHQSKRRTNFPRVIQTDVIADIERMGGPVFDLDGNCLGMNIASADRCETYAIPAQELKSLAEEMISKAK